MSATPWGNTWERERVTHARESSGTVSMPSMDRVRLAPRPRSRLSRFSGPREVDEGRMLPTPPRPNCKEKKRSVKDPVHDAFHRHHRHTHTHSLAAERMEISDGRSQLTDWRGSRPRERERSIDFKSSVAIGTIKTSVWEM